jgi:hypothetical protein
VKAPVISRSLTDREVRIARLPESAFVVKKAKPGKGLQLAKNAVEAKRRLETNFLFYVTKSLTVKLSRPVSVKEVLEAERRICRPHGKYIRKIRSFRNFGQYSETLQRELSNPRK